MEKILIVVDMQKDFVDGSLGTKEAQSIVPAVKDKIENFEGDIIFTKDTHEEDYLNTQEGQNLPVVHCIRGTAGHEIIEELQPYTKRALAIFEKETFGSRKLAGFLKELHKENRVYRAYWIMYRYLRCFECLAYKSISAGSTDICNGWLLRRSYTGKT